MNQKIITVDFDGVVIEKIAGVDWKVQRKSAKPKSGLWWSIYKVIDKCWTCANHIIRKPIPGAKEGLTTLKNRGFKIILLTSRYSYHKDTTLKWMKKWEFYELYDDFYFNDKNIGAIDSKINNLKSIEAEYHIDDNLMTVDELAKEFPGMTIFYLNERPYTGINDNVRQVDVWNKIQI